MALYVKSKKNEFQAMEKIAISHALSGVICCADKTTMALLRNLSRGHRRPGILPAAICLTVFATCSWLISCSGGGSSGSSSGPQPDFSLSAQPATLVIAASGTQSAQLSASGINGFSGSVQVSATPPSGVSVSPNSFSLTVGAAQQLTISAVSSISAGPTTVLFTANSGSLTHTATLQVDVDLPVTSPHPPFRTRYLRTDVQYSPNVLNFFPPHFTAYDSVHKRFFVSNPSLNRIDVFDSVAESQLGSVIVPMPWGIDIAPGGSTLYAATIFGDIYLVDPSALSVTQVYPAGTIGSQGYAATQPFILASGQLALFGGFAALNVDGAQSFAIWNPTTNNLQVINPEIFGNAAFSNIGQMSLTADQSDIVVSSADSDGTLGLYDPTTGVAITGQAAGIVCEILPTPDGSRLFMTHQYGQFEVFNANTLAKLGTFTSSGNGSYSAVLSPDGSTLFSTDILGNVSAYDTTSFSQNGWVPNFDVFDSQQDIVLSVSDETGLIVGPIGHGVAFLDTTQIEPGLAQTIFTIGFLSPGTGSPSGGTAIQAQVSEQNSSTTENINSGTIYMGNMTANNLSLSNTTATGLAPPASSGGPADFAVVLSDGSIQLNPENFSYGPTIVELSTNAASADGGSQGVIFGYGLGQQPSDVTVSVGGQSAAVTQVIPSASPLIPYPFPMEAVLFTIPPGVAGNAATVTVTTVIGSATSTSPLNYVPAVQSYELSGAELMQGVFDPTRSVVYFTGQAQIDVFSVSTSNWLAPITIGYTNSASRLVGVGLSADGNTLAVSDAGNANIYVLNPSSPTQIKSFHVQPPNVGNLQPYGLVTNNAGIIYYASYDSDIDPPGGFHALDSATGNITNYEAGGGSSYDRVLMSPDGSYVYGSEPWVLNTTTGLISEGIEANNIGDGNVDMALSGDGSTLLTEDLLTDASLNVQGDITYVDRDVWLAMAEYGQKLNTDGSLVFQPLTDGIDVHDAATGLLTYRVELPIQITNAYDALVIDNPDGLLFAITASGIAEINLRSLPTPAFKHARILAARNRHSGNKETVDPANALYKKRKGVLDRPHLRHSTRLP
jgi:hypothetical protein